MAEKESRSQPHTRAEQRGRKRAKREKTEDFGEESFV